jgi:hypothetical protein
MGGCHFDLENKSFLFFSSLGLWLRKQELFFSWVVCHFDLESKSFLLMDGCHFYLENKDRDPRVGESWCSFWGWVGGWEAAAMSFASGLGLAMPYYSSTFFSSSFTHCHHAHHHLHLPLQRSYFNSAIPLRLLITPSVHCFYVCVCVSLFAVSWIICYLEERMEDIIGKSLCLLKWKWWSSIAHCSEYRIVRTIMAHVCPLLVYSIFLPQ